MDKILQGIYLLAAIVGLGISVFNWYKVSGYGQDRYHACAVGMFVTGAGFAFLHIWVPAVLAGVTILLLALHRWTSSKT